jgi:hypothetical protein
MAAARSTRAYLLALALMVGLLLAMTGVASALSANCCGRKERCRDE